MDLGLKIQKTNVGIRINIFEIACLPIFKQNGQRTSPNSESAAPRYHEYQFQSKRTALNFLAELWRNCPVPCNILVLITLRVLQRAERRLKCAEWR